VFIIFYYDQQKQNYITKSYITTVSLCNLPCYMFRDFRVIVREFKTND